jgi:H+/Cl- antiporter ClcA
MFVNYFTRILTKWKFNQFHTMIHKEKHDDAPYGSAFLLLLCCDLIFVILAYISCYIEPLAAGSGIPEIKCFLNGLNIPRLTSIKTLISKALGIIFSCSSSLPLGKEGPMIHAGSIIGAAVSQGNTISFGFDTSWNIFQDLRNDHTKRDYITYGAAAGVAAA